MSSCRDCRFSRLDQQFGQTALQCRFNPPEIKPIPQANGNITFAAMWPQTAESAWCGKYERDPAQMERKATRDAQELQRA